MEAAETMHTSRLTPREALGKEPGQEFGLFVSLEQQPVLVARIFGVPRVAARRPNRRDHIVGVLGLDRLVLGHTESPNPPFDDPVGPFGVAPAANWHCRGEEFGRPGDEVPGPVRAHGVTEDIATVGVNREAFLQARDQIHDGQDRVVGSSVKVTHPPSAAWGEMA